MKMLKTEEVSEDEDEDKACEEEIPEVDEEGDFDELESDELAQLREEAKEDPKQDVTDNNDEGNQ